MKQIFLFLIIILFVHSAYSSETWQAMNSQKPTTYKSNVEKINTTIKIKLHWPGFFKKWNSEQQAYQIYTPGSYTLKTPNEFQVPFISHLITVPENTEPKLLIQYSSTIIFGDMPIVKNADQLIQNNEFYSREMVLRNKFQPRHTPLKVNIQKIGHTGDQDILKINMYPFQVIEEKQQLLVAEQATIQLIFPKKYPNIFTKSIPKLFNTLIQPVSWEEDIDNETQDEPSEEYLIITPKKFEQTLQPLVEWRTQEGLKVVIKTTEHIKASQPYLTADHLHKYLIRYFQQNGNLTYILLVGDVEYIPVKYKNGDGTDFYYSLLDDQGDLFPDVYLGRFPVNTESELTAIIHKTISYESTMPGKKVVFASHFQDAGLDGVCDRDYIYTSELFQQFLTKRQYNCQRIYTKTEGTTPTYYSNRTPVAKDITFNGTTQDIVNAINTGVALINHRGHGTETTWQNPYFHIKDIAALYNNKFPILFNVNCATGKFNAETESQSSETATEKINTDKESLSEQLLNTQHGVVAIIAPTQETTYPVNNIFNQGLMGGIWPKMFQECTSPAQRLGQVLYRGRIKVLREYDTNGWLDERILGIFRKYHILGDPALHIRQPQ